MSTPPNILTNAIAALERAINLCEVLDDYDVIAAKISEALACLRSVASAPADASPAPPNSALFVFQIGATVFKHRGSYKLHGTVRAHFFTKDGDPRYVVDHEPTVPGLLHIYNEEQLMAAAPDAGRDGVVEEIVTKLKDRATYFRNQSEDAENNGLEIYAGECEAIAIELSGQAATIRAMKSETPK
jgi:hypothetical protein